MDCEGRRRPSRKCKGELSSIYGTLTTGAFGSTSPLWKDNLCHFFREERILSGQGEDDSRPLQIGGFLGRQDRVARLTAAWETRFSLIEAGACRGWTAKVEKGSTCQALGLSTPPGGWCSVLVSQSPASGGGCGARGLKAPWLQSMSIQLFCSCVPHVRSSGISRAAVQARRDARRSGAT